MPVTDTPQTPGATSPGGSPDWTIAEMDKVGR